MIGFVFFKTLYLSNTCHVFLWVNLSCVVSFQFLYGDFKNFKADGKLANGVNASFLPSAVAADTKGLTSNPSSKTLSKLTQLAFVEFLPSQYSQSAPNELMRLSKKMVDTPKTRNWHCSVFHNLKQI